MEAKKEMTQEEKLPAEVRANLLSNQTSVYFNVALFEQFQRVATMFANSTMVPKHFRGNIGNCMIALNYANRLRADEFMVFQNLYEVHGTPGIQGKLVEAIINQSNKYSETLDYEWLDPEDKPTERRNVLNANVPSEYGCQAFTIEAKTEKRVTGPKITWQLVKDEGWYDKNGPDGTIKSNKWRTMPEMMFYYRSAAWFGNKNCPELTLGMYTIEELEDITEMRKMPDGSFKIKESVADKLKGKGTQPEGKDIYETKDVEPTLKEQTEKEPDEPPAKEDDEDPIREFKGLTPRAFKKILKVHMNEIPTLPQEHQDAIKALWNGHFPGQPFPALDKDNSEKPNKAEKTKLSDEEKEAKILKLVEGAERDSMRDILVPCPNRQDVTIKYTMCDPCMYKAREGCPTWSSYDSERA